MAKPLVFKKSELAEIAWLARQSAIGAYIYKSDSRKRRWALLADKCAAISQERFPPKAPTPAPEQPATQVGAAPSEGK